MTKNTIQQSTSTLPKVN